MAESLRVMFESGAVEVAETRASIVSAVDTLLTAGAADGSLRADDVLSSLLGIFLASGSRDQSSRLLDLLVDGLVSTR